MRLTEAQKEEVNQIQRHLIQQIGEREVTVEYTAAAMMEVCENLDYDMAVSICQRIWQGAGELYRLCREDDAITEPDYVERMLDRITEKMSREQRKGFFLLALDSFEREQEFGSNMGNRAVKTEQELKNLLSNRIRVFAEDVAWEMANIAQEPCFQQQNRDVSLKQRIAKEDAFLFAVAVYLAGLNGVLPQEFGEYPELLGICSAVQMVLYTCCEGYKTEIWENGWPLSDMVSGIICAAFGAVLMLTSSVVGIAAESILFAMEFSQIGFLISIFSSTALYIWFIAGGLMFAGGLGTVLALCMKKIREKRQQNRAEAVFSEENGAVKTEWRNRRDTEDEESRAKVMPNGV